MLLRSRIARSILPPQRGQNKPGEGQITKSGRRVTPLVTFDFYWLVGPCPRPGRTVVPKQTPEQTRGTQKKMTDHYQSFVSSPVGKLFVKNLGLPNPTELERWTEGAPVVDGTVVTGGSGRLGKALTVALDNLGVSNVGIAPEGEKFKALVFDATGITHSTGPDRAPAVLHPADAQPDRQRPRAWSSAPCPSRSRTTTSASPSARSRASPARSARRSARAAPSTWCTSPPAPRRPSSPRSPSSSPPRAPTSPARWPVSVPPARRRPRRSPTPPSR